MSSSPVPALLSAATAGQPSRASSAFVAKAARGFQVFRIDGYSWTTTLPGGERITSDQFVVGGRAWGVVDYYPNGGDATTDSGDSVALYLRLIPSYNSHGATPKRVRAQYKFSLLDLDGNAAYELPAETGIFLNKVDGQGEEVPAGCGYACFITKDDLEKRRSRLLRDDSLAIRCDVGVTEVSPAGGAKHGRPRYGGYGSYGYDNGADSGDDDGSHDGRRRGQGPPSDKEFIRRCLSSRRRN